VVDVTPDSLLTFERDWPGHSRRKAQAIRDMFGVSPVRYYAALNRVIDSTDAVLIDPTLVLRLRRLRAQRYAKRMVEAS
jgi:hypothetical protein